MVNFGAANDKNSSGQPQVSQFSGTIDGFYWGGSSAGGAGGGGAAKDDVASIGQWAADGFMCFPSHDDRMAEGQGLEEFEVFGEVPWQRAGPADEAVGGHGDDGVQRESSGIQA